MFGSLTKKFQELFAGLVKNKVFTEENLGDAIREVRLALLDADVNYAVASQFVKRVKEKALGGETLKSATPGQQFIKIVHDELVALMGSEEKNIDLSGHPSVVLLCGLQGSGKTTQAAKLGFLLQKKPWNKKVLLAACDLQRPAAVLQLTQLAAKAGLAVCSLEEEKDPQVVAKEALKLAKAGGYDVLIVDTAGRLHIDEELMQELRSLKDLLHPQEILFVANAALGQDAVRAAGEFDKRLEVTGVVLTMLDSNARAGAALSIREITGKPLKFEGIGEQLEDLRVFNPVSMADRILGMGDVVNLVKRVEESVDEEERKDLEKKIRKASFTYGDYLKQMSMLKKMGSLKGLLKMLPGASELSELPLDEKEFKKIEAIILSMTPAEREERVELEPSRRRRLAKGSGVSIDDVNRMVKSFRNLKQFLKGMPGMEKKMSKMTGNKENFPWH